MFNMKYLKQLYNFTSSSQEDSIPFHIFRFFGFKNGLTFFNTYNMLGRFICSLLFLTLYLSGLKANTDQGLAIDNFVLTDINGQKYELDQLMSEGKHVILNFGTTWAPSSWNYEKTEALSNVRKLNTITGKEDLVVLFLEADLNTDLNCIKGNENCNYSSMGNWTSLIDYPIIDLTEEELNYLRKYQIDEYPTVYGIKPDRKISSLGQADINRVLGWMEGEAVAYNEMADLNNATQFISLGDNSEINQVVISEVSVDNNVNNVKESTEEVETNYTYINKFTEETGTPHHTQYDILSMLALADMDTNAQSLGLLTGK